MDDNDEMHNKPNIVNVMSNLYCTFSAVLKSAEQWIKHIG